MSQLKVDLDLVKKYNVPGPRYTSYPPATHFTSEIAPEAFAEKIRSNNQSSRDLSLYLQLHFGGGTPTFSHPDEIRRLGEMIQSRFTFAPDIEAGVEVDPRRLTREHLKALREVGFNRASMGVQDNDPVVQKAVHRLQPFEMT